MTSEELIVMCSPTLNVYCDIILATPTNSLAVPIPSLRVYRCNKRDMQAKFYDCTVMYFIPVPVPYRKVKRGRDARIAA